MKPIINTIFTPTYNRAHTLPKLYESLKKQTCKDFEWLVVDDGSSDDTKSLIDQYISENFFPIQYYFQENQGKHIAINLGLKHAEGDYFTVVDSDDYLRPEAVEVCRMLIDKVKDKKDFAGFTFIHFSENHPIDFSKYGNKEWINNQQYNWEYPGEMSFCYKTNIVKQYPFPVFKDENFCQESLVLNRIGKKYHVLFTDHILRHGDYLEDGLSQSIYNRILENPKYSLLVTKEKLSCYKDHADKLYQAKVYWDIAMKTGGGFFKNIFGIPLKYTYLIFKEKLKNKK